MEQKQQEQPKYQPTGYCNWAPGVQGWTEGHQRVTGFPGEDSLQGVGVKLCLFVWLGELRAESRLGVGSERTWIPQPPDGWRGGFREVGRRLMGGGGVSIYTSQHLASVMPRQSFVLEVVLSTGCNWEEQISDWALSYWDYCESKWLIGWLIKSSLSDLSDRTWG